VAVYLALDLFFFCNSHSLVIALRQRLNKTQSSPYLLTFTTRRNKGTNDPTNGGNIEIKNRKTLAWLLARLQFRIDRLLPFASSFFFSVTMHKRATCSLFLYRHQFFQIFLRCRLIILLFFLYFSLSVFYFVLFWHRKQRIPEMFSSLYLQKDTEPSP